jgi:O-antigen/teichoic acid export membrane protein
VGGFQNIKNKISDLSVEVKATYWFLICGVLQKGLTLITTPIFTRLMSASEYGVFSVYISWNNILTIFVTLEMAAGVYLRGLVKFDDDKRSYSNSIYCLETISFLFWIIVYFLFRENIAYCLNLDSKYILVMLIDIYVCAAFGFWSVEQRANFKYKKLVVITFTNSLIQTIIGIIAVLNTADHVSARIYTLVASDVLCLGIFCFVPLFRRGSKIKFFYWRYALKFNIPLIPHYLSQVVLNQADRIMIERYASVDDAGRYSLAYSLATVMTIVSSAIIKTLTPWLYKKIKEEDYSSIRKNSVLILILFAGVNVFLVALAPEAIYILAPQEYWGAVYVVPPVSAGVYFIFLYNWFSIFEFYFEKTYLMTIASVGGAFSNIILNYFFIRRFGYLAAGYTTLFCYILFSIGHGVFMILICKKEIPGTRIYNMKMIIFISVVFILLCFILMLLYNNYILRYIVISSLLLFVAFNFTRIRLIFNNILKQKSK